MTRYKPLQLNQKDIREIAKITDSKIENKVGRILDRIFLRGIVVSVTGNCLTSVLIEGDGTPTPRVLSLDNFNPQIDDKVLLANIGRLGINKVILGRRNCAKYEIGCDELSPAIASYMERTVEIDSVTVLNANTSSAAGTDIDLSSYVSETATWAYMEVHTRHSTTGGLWVLLHKKGDINRRGIRVWTDGQNFHNTSGGLVPLSADKQVTWITNDGTNRDITIYLYAYKELIPCPTRAWNP